MRLTLRTLLAYLDDTLDPTEIKQIGQKVAESDAAQELIARIKQVTRRRRLTTPPATGPGAKFDPNTLAEYLDNVLDNEAVADVEKTCLESDVHLAEVAACHQILTLVLGEPALVPPTARQRMYALVQGREAIPYRKASLTPAGARAAEGPDADAGDVDETLLGLPFAGKKGGGIGWLLPVLAVGLVVALGVVLWLALAGNNPNNPYAYNNRSATNPEVPPVRPQPTQAEPRPFEPRATQPEPKPPEPPPSPPPSPPAPAGTEVGTVALFKNTPHLLLQRPADKDAWQRLRPGSKVAVGDTLVALPGSRSLVQTSTGAELLLWGNVREFLNIPLLESGVVLQQNPEVDLEFTLDRGRVLVANRKDKGPVKVRVHFNEEKPKPAETWELTLEEPDTEVALDLFGRYPQDVGFTPKGGEGPMAELYLVVLQGEAGIKIGRETFGGLKQGSLISWDNKGPGVVRPAAVDNPKELVLWDKTFPALQNTKEADAVAIALDELVKRSGEKPELVLEESLQSDRAATRVLAVYCLGALDALPKLLDALADEDERHVDVRQTAISALRHWIGRRADYDLKLYETLQAKRYTPKQAETVMQLLHDFSAQQLDAPETWGALIAYLKSDKVAIRELSYWHLFHLVRKGREPKYYPGVDSQKRDVAYDEWKKLIPDGKLPPPPK